MMQANAAGTAKWKGAPGAGAPAMGDAAHAPVPDGSAGRQSLANLTALGQADTVSLVAMPTVG